MLHAKPGLQGGHGDPGRLVLHAGGLLLRHGGLHRVHEDLRPDLLADEAGGGRPEDRARHAALPVPAALGQCGEVQKAEPAE